MSSGCRVLGAGSWLMEKEKGNNGSKYTIWGSGLAGFRLPLRHWKVWSLCDAFGDCG